MTGAELRERIVAVLCSDGLEPEQVLAEQNLAGLIDSLKFLELTAEIEECLQITIPDGELTEQNFSSIPAVMLMVDRLTREAA